MCPGRDDSVFLHSHRLVAVQYVPSTRTYTATTAHVRTRRASQTARMRHKHTGPRPIRELVVRRRQFLSSTLFQSSISSPIGSGVTIGWAESREPPSSRQKNNADIAQTDRRVSTDIECMWHPIIPSPPVFRQRLQAFLFHQSFPPNIVL